MNILIRNATIVPMTSGDRVLQGSIAIQGKKIFAVGTEPNDFHPDRIIDATGMAAIPGLVNAHTHLSMEYFRNYRDSVSDLHNWLEGIWKLENRLVPDDILPVSRLGIAEMIRSGTTCFADMYFFPEETCRAVLESGIKANIGITLFGDLADSRQRVAKRLPAVSRYCEQSGGNIRYDIAPHAVYTCSADSYRYAVQLVREHDCGIHTHVSETAKEVADCRREHGLSPVAYLESLGVLETRSYLAHCVHPDEGDLEILQRSRATVVHNPSSNCKLASGIAPLASMRSLGIPTALGTDSAASNNTLDLFREIRLAAMLASVSNTNPVAIAPYALLHMATIGGAEALGRGHECGTIEAGKDADIVLIDLNKPHLTPVNNIFSALVFAIGSSDVHTVLCAGEVVMENRELKTIDITAAMDATNRHWHDILRRSDS